MKNILTADGKYAIYLYQEFLGGAEGGIAGGSTGRDDKTRRINISLSNESFNFGDPRGREWNVVHELAHAWDFSTRIRVLNKVEYLGHVIWLEYGAISDAFLGYINRTEGAGYKWVCTCGDSLKEWWTGEDCIPESRVYNSGEAPSAYAKAAHVEDFAESVASYVYPNRAGVGSINNSRREFLSLWFDLVKDPNFRRTLQ